ncbi:MAG: hypothetical protein WCH99_21745 [Verrucomicrobiota bacterium]
MKLYCLFINSTLVASAIWFVGCSTAPKTVQLNGKIFITDGGKLQKTGLAPIWIYDATNTQLTTQIPLPNFGGRSRTDLARIRKEYPAVLTVCSNYQAAVAQDKFSSFEMKYENLNQKYSDKKEALRGQTNGPDFDVLKQLGGQIRQVLEARDRVIDEGDDARELIFYWFNVNPGILYAGLPQPLVTAQTDTNGNFSVTLPKDKNILLVAHIEGTINGEPGHYFIRWPLAGGWTGTKRFIFGNSSTCLIKRSSELKPTIIYSENGIMLGPIHRTRDSQLNWRPYWQQYYSLP